MKSLLAVFISIVLVSSNSISKVWKVPSDCSTIQAALDSCQTGDTVLVSLGTYFENIIWPSTNGIKLLPQNWWPPYNATIDADMSGSAIRIETGVDTSTVVSGFIIQNGVDGGIRCVGSSPTIENNLIVANSSTGRGGGIACAGNSSPTIKNNVIENNWAIDAGGGIYFDCDESSSPQIINNVINNNHTGGLPGAGGWGAGIAICGNSQVLISSNIISNNSGHPVDSYGGGIYCVNSSARIINNQILSNECSNEGGGIFCGSSPKIIHNFIAGNVSIGGAIDCFHNSSPIIDSCFIINNNSDGIKCSFGSNPQIYYNDIYGNTGYGLRNMDSTVIINAPYNWWGDNSGPYHPILNPLGLGDQVSDNVNFEPWLIKVLNEIEEENIIADKYSLYQNYPNPFNPSTTIKYSIPHSSNVIIKIFDILGNEIETLVNEEKQKGTYEINWNPENLPSGVYLYQLKAGFFVETKKMVLMK